MFLLRPLLRPFWSYCALFELLRPFLSFYDKNGKIAHHQLELKNANHVR